MSCPAGVSLVLLLVLAGGVRPLPAQSPAERTGLEALRDSLVGVTDSAALKRLEAATIAAAKADRDDPLIHLRLGFLAYRLGELANSKQHYDDAAGEFEWASELRPGWPYPWYGLGLAELAQGEHSVIAIENLRQQFGLDYLSKAARAFARATQVEPSFSRAAIDLANTALRQRIHPQLQIALETVRLAAAAAVGRDPALQLARGRVEREVGDPDSALAAFRAYLAVGGDSGIGLLELARTDYLTGRASQGWRAYFTGARAARSAEALALYQADLRVFARPAELARFDGFTSPAARAEWLERFWLRRDVAEARDSGERLAEHYHRWFYAREHFRLVSRHRHYSITEPYRSTQEEFDDRGVIYLRHGAPDDRASYPSLPEQLEPNETWAYRRADGDLIFHFVARRDVQDYKLVESLADALESNFGSEGGFGAALLLKAQRGLSPFVSDLFASRAEISPLYARLGNTIGSANFRGALDAERQVGHRSIAVGTTTDTYRQRFDVPLDMVVSEFVVGNRTAPGPALHAVFAIPAQRLTAVPESARILYPLSFRVFVSDSSDSLLARLDTTRVFAAPERLKGGTYLTGQLVLPVPPGTFRYRLLVVAAAGSAGELVTRDSVAADSLDGRRFGASDLVLGLQGSGLVWADGRDTVALNPLGRVPERGAVELYYELYGLAPGTSYHTVVRLERGRKRRAPVFLEFDALADAPVMRVHRQVDLRDVSRGDYVLTVQVTDPTTGATVSRSSRFVVVGR